MVRSFERIFVRLVGYLCSSLFGVMVVVSLLQVFFRYVLNDSLVWSEELARYLFVWVSFLGAAIALHRGMHIEVDILTVMVSDRVRIALWWLVQVLVMALLIVLILYGIKITLLTWNTPSAALRIPMGLVYLAIPAGSVAMLVVLLLQAGRGMTGGDVVQVQKEAGHGSLHTN